MLNDTSYIVLSSESDDVEIVTEVPSDRRRKRRRLHRRSSTSRTNSDVVETIDDLNSLGTSETIEVPEDSPPACSSTSRYDDNHN